MVAKASAFSIPMRGNEDPVEDGVGEVGAGFSIPMRGNEDNTDWPGFFELVQFSIPMRGNERLLTSDQTRGSTGFRSP